MPGRIVRRLHWAEKAAADLSLYLLVLVPALEVIVRTFFASSLPNSNAYTQHLVLVTPQGVSYELRPCKLYITLFAGIFYAFLQWTC